MCLNFAEALDLFLEGAVSGYTLAMVDAELVYWEMDPTGSVICLFV